MHCAHCALAVAPMALLYVPGMHGWQVPASDAPKLDDHVPTEQLRQTVADVAAGTLDQVPALHARHTTLLDAPIAVEYVPEGQLLHML